MSIESWASGLFGSGGGMSPGGLGGTEDIGFGGGNLWAGGTGETAGNPLFNFSGSEGKGTWTPSGDVAGTDWKKLGKIAGDLSKSVGAGKMIPDTAPQGGAPGGGGGGTGGGDAPGLESLLAMLAKRREQWMQSAMSGEVPKQSATSGLLGL